MGDFVNLTVEDGVGTIRLDRPKMNAIDFQVQAELLEVASQAAADDAVRAVVVYGGERLFAAGNDVKEMADLSYAEMAKRVGGVQAAVTAATTGLGISATAVTAACTPATLFAISA